jgi:hypothetical protein
MPLARAACNASNISWCQVPGTEADDVIASYAETAKAQGFKVYKFKVYKLQIWDQGTNLIFFAL